MAPTTMDTWRDEMNAVDFGDEAPAKSPDGDLPEPDHTQRLTVDKQQTADDDPTLGEREIKFIASTAAEDRDGDVINQGGIKLGDFQRSGVFLWSHRQDLPPLGEIRAAGIEDGRMTTVVRFPTPEEFGAAEDHPWVQKIELVYQLYKNNLLHAVSIGFLADPEDIEEREDAGFRFEEVEVIELSAVSVPSNRGAVAVERAMGSESKADFAKALQSLADKHNLDLTTKAMPTADDTPADDEMPETDDKGDMEPTETKESRTLSKANEARAVEVMVQAHKMMADHDEKMADEVLKMLGEGTHPMEGEDMMEDEDKSVDSEQTEQQDKDVDRLHLVFLPGAKKEVAESMSDRLTGMMPEGHKIAAFGCPKGVTPEVKTIGADAPSETTIDARGALTGTEQEVADKLSEMVNTEREMRGDASTADSPDLPVKEFATKEVTDYRDLALAPRDREWDSEAAVGRWREFSDSTEEPSEQYKENFIWYDAGDPNEFGSYKLPYGDAVDGEHIAVPRGVFAVAAALEGARGGVDIPESDIDDAKAHVEQYYGKMRDQFDDDGIVAPWRSENSFNVWLAKQADALGIEKAPTLWLADKMADGRFKMPEPEQVTDKDTGTDEPADEQAETPAEGGKSDDTDVEPDEAEQASEAPDNVTSLDHLSDDAAIAIDF